MLPIPDMCAAVFETMFEVQSRIIFRIIPENQLYALTKIVLMYTT